MTIPTLQNCEHQGEGWCLDCVQKLQEKITRLETVCEDFNGERDPIMWVCYNCGAEFSENDHELAAKHFGVDSKEPSWCVKEMNKYYDEILQKRYNEFLEKSKYPPYDYSNDHTYLFGEG